MIDDLQGQFLLASVAVGLNFCNKLSLSAEARRASLAYAATHLKAFCARFDVPMPSEAKELKLHDETQPVEITNDWEPFLQACHEFDDEHTYVLVIGPQTGRDGAILSAIGRVPWTLILDFDP